MNRNSFAYFFLLAVFAGLLPAVGACAQPRLSVGSLALDASTKLAMPSETQPIAIEPVQQTNLVAGIERADQADRLVIPRILTETAMGYGVGFLAQLIGMVAGISAGCVGPGSTRESCGWGMLIGGSLGNVFVTPLGTIVMGHVFRGNGNYLGALLGSLAGTALEYAIGVPFILSAPERGAIEIALYLSALLPAIGATIGYELQSDARNDELRTQGLSVVPNLAPTFAADGSGVNGAVIGATFYNL